MPIPKKVKQAAKAAEEIHKQVYAPVTDPNAPVVDAETGEIIAQAEAETDGVVDPTPPAVSEGEPPPVAQDEPPTETPPVEVQPPAAPPVITPPIEEGDDAKWEQRYRSLQGRNEQLNTRLQGMEAMFAALESATNTPPTTPSDEAAKKFLTSSDVDDYGEDLLDVIKRAAREEVAPYLDRIAQLEQENKALKEGLGGVSQSVAKNARDEVYSQLVAAVPNWGAINKDPTFNVWLGEVDAFAGRMRGDMLKEAFEKNDAARVVLFFQSFLSENTAFNQEQPTTTTPAARTPPADLQTLVAPGRSRGAGPSGPAQGGKRVYSQRDIAAFYRDVNRGRYKGREKERNTIELDIIEAAKEPGRITA